MMIDEERDTSVEALDEELPEEENAIGAAPDEAPVEEAEVAPAEEDLHADLPDEHLPAGRRCPNVQCQYDKHYPDANFCILCGTLLFTHCNDCLGNNAPYARFCHLCGADLDELRVERVASE